MPLTVTPAQAFVRPGQPARFTVAGTITPGTHRVEAVVTHLATVVERITWEATANDGGLSTRFEWLPPAEAGRGYGVEVSVDDLTAATACDVLERWTDMPRYGFLTDFAPGRPDLDQAVSGLLPYHVNALQFYDWMWRHEELLPPSDPHTDLLGKESSLATVKALIERAHGEGMAALPYAAVYAASHDVAARHPEWLLYDGDGKPIPFGEEFLTIVDPRPGGEFGRHLLAQFRRVLTETGFDGIHLDQYGAPKLAYLADGTPLPLAGPLADLIDATAELVDELRSGGATVFNCVNNWPTETVAARRQDITYIEVWEPHTGYDDVWRIITDAQRLGAGKPVVLAAYLDPAFGASVLIFDAVCLANGAGHIELGEGDALLADPYFPNYRPMDPDLAEALRLFYDFAVRYQEVTGPTTVARESPPVWVDGQRRPTGSGARPFCRDWEGGFTVNLVDLPDGEWTTDHPFPASKSGTELVVGLDRPVTRVWAATPSRPEAVEVAFQIHETDVAVETGEWDVWAMVVFETGA